jgi:hypothetical protein
VAGDRFAPTDALSKASLPSHEAGETPALAGKRRERWEGGDGRPPIPRDQAPTIVIVRTISAVVAVLAATWTR